MRLLFSLLPLLQPSAEIRNRPKERIPENSSAHIYVWGWGSGGVRWVFHRLQREFQQHQAGVNGGHLFSEAAGKRNSSYSFQGKM